MTSPLPPPLNVTAIIFCGFPLSKLFNCVHFTNLHTYFSSWLRERFEPPVPVTLVKRKSNFAWNINFAKNKVLNRLMLMPTPYNWMNEIRDVSKIGCNTPLPPLRKLCLNIYITAPPPLNPGDGLDHPTPAPPSWSWSAKWRLERMFLHSKNSETY